MKKIFINFITILLLVFPRLVVAHDSAGVPGETPYSIFDQTTDPTVNNDVGDGYTEGSIWLNKTSKEQWTCTDNSPGAAKWDVYYTQPQLNSTTDGASGISLIGVPSLSGSVTNLELSRDNTASAGLYSGGVITDGGGEAASVATLSGTIRIADDHDASLLTFSIVGSTVPIPTDTTRWIGVEYNSGSPQIVSKTSDTWNRHTEFPLGAVVNENTTLHVICNPSFMANMGMHALHRFYDTLPLQRADRRGGLLIGETGTRNVTVTSSEIYDRLTEFVINAINTSSGDDFDSYSSSGLESSADTQWDNDNYDNAGTLTTLGINKYVNLWWYVETDGELVCVYGTAQYATANAAEDETPPSVIPARLQVHGKFIGRFIVQKSAGTVNTIQSVFDTAFGPSAAADHGGLSGLTNDDHEQYLLITGTRAMTGNLDFDQNEAVEMVKHQGATFPTAPVDGQVFYHTPTGRKIPYDYDDNAAEWCSEKSIGDMTVYVDNTDGTDDLDLGGAVDAGAFQTIQFAIDSIPGGFGGDVLVNINDETYSESLIIRGKRGTGDFTITLQGTKTQEATGTVSSFVVGGAGVLSTIDVAGTPYSSNEHQHRMLVFDSGTTTVALRDITRVIDTNDTNTLTVVGYLPGTPVSGDTFVIYSPGTVITSGSAVTLLVDGVVGVELADIKFEGTSASFSVLDIRNFAKVVATTCWSEKTVRGGFTDNVSTFSQFNANNCFVAMGASGSGGTVSYTTNTSIIVRRDGKIYSPSSGQTITTNSLGFFVDCVFDGQSAGGNFGVWVELNSVLFYTSNSDKMLVRNSDYGTRMFTGAQGKFASKINYSNISIADEQIDSATFASLN